MFAFCPKGFIMESKKEGPCPRRPRRGAGGEGTRGFGTQGRRMSMRIVVIGGVAAGTKAAAKLKREQPDAEVVLFSKGRDISYAGRGPV